MTELDSRVVVLTAVLVGGWVGSFLAAAGYRLRRGMSVVYPPSHCPVCRHAIRARDLLPVLSWLWLKGKCRDCQAAIASKYPAIELATAILFGVSAWWLIGRQ